jgi:hypothetical protein
MYAVRSCRKLSGTLSGIPYRLNSHALLPRGLLHGLRCADEIGSRVYKTMHMPLQEVDIDHTRELIGIYRNIHRQTATALVAGPVNA